MHTQLGVWDTQLFIQYSLTLLKDLPLRFLFRALSPCLQNNQITSNETKFHGQAPFQSISS